MSALVVNFYGGPGTGKSTMAARIFAELKDIDLNVELVTEYAKDLTWQESYKTLSNQIYVFGKQQNRLWRLKDKVDIILTDAPLLNSIIYNTEYSTLNELVEEEYNRYNNFDIFLERVKKYNLAGRSQSKEEAIKIDNRTKEALYQLRKCKIHLLNKPTEEVWYDLKVNGHSDSVATILYFLLKEFYKNK